MRFPTALLVVLGALVVPAATRASVEITLTAGLRSGDASFPIEARIDPSSPVSLACITTPCLLADASTGDGEALPSLIVDVPFSRQWAVEGLLSRQDGRLSLSSSRVPPEVVLAPESWESSTAQLGLRRQWDGERLRPFVAGAVGRTWFESSAVAYDRPFFPGIAATRVDEDVFSASLAGGVSIGLARHLAVRVEARSFWHDLPERLGGTLQQTEAGVGITYRW